MNASVVRAALRPTARATPLLPAAAGALLGLMFVVSASGENVVARLVAAAVLAAAGTGFALDDPAALTLEASPTPLAVRRSLRAALVFTMVGLAWSIDLVVAARFAPRGASLPVDALTLELSAFVAVVLAISAAAARRSSDGRGGAIAAPAFVVLVFGTNVLAYLWPAFPGLLPHTPHHDRWIWVLVGATALLGWLNRDPATRSRPRHRRARPRSDPMS